MCEGCASHRFVRVRCRRQRAQAAKNWSKLAPCASAADSLTHQDPRQFPDTIAKPIAIKHLYATMFASLLTKLDAVPEGSGILLDNSIVVRRSELGDAYVHNPEPTPFIVAGGGAGALRMGQHLDCQGVYTIGSWSRFAKPWAQRK